ncbi:MAG TPA: HAD-IA family hydrolase [Terriglobales bacterium]|nr:HAD-IA family hydrolase [Terriglobales bacterium]
MKIELVAFDIAGTLIEDHDEVTFAFHSALQQHGIFADFAELREFKGGAKREVIRHFVAKARGTADENLVEAVFADFRRILEEDYQPAPIAGVEGALRRLRERKIKVATTTGFYRELRDAILRRLGWSAVFDANVCSDDVARGRPSPEMIFRTMELCGVSDPGKAMAVGDTPFDLQAGTAAGCGAVVGVLTGVHPRERLEREPHTHIVASAAEIAILIE